jgi:tRNA U34 5-carboxymethylaminomethyl modifying enzyme MnmG/GidA
LQTRAKLLIARKSLYALEHFCLVKYIWVRLKVSPFPATPNLFAGLKRFPAGRMGEAPSTGLSASLASAGFALGRLQTGTPARLDKNTINFVGLERQDGDQHPLPFSFLNKAVDNAVRTFIEIEGVKLKKYQDNQVACFRTATTPETHQVVKDNLHLSVHIQETKKGIRSPHRVPPLLIYIS